MVNIQAKPYVITITMGVKNKLDSYLDSCHTKALVLMRQLQYVERALLKGEIYSFDQAGSAAHLSGVLAKDAEMILVDMM